MNCTEGTVMHMGKPAIIFTGEHNGRMNVIAVVSDKRFDLFVQTVYANVKKGNLSTPTGEQAPINTPEANSGTVSNSNVAQENPGFKGQSFGGNETTDTQNEHGMDAMSEDMNREIAPVMSLSYGGEQHMQDSLSALRLVASVASEAEMPLDAPIAKDYTEGSETAQTVSKMSEDDFAPFIDAEGNNNSPDVQQAAISDSGADTTMPETNTIS